MHDSITGIREVVYQQRVKPGFAVCHAAIRARLEVHDCSYSSFSKRSIERKRLKPMLRFISSIAVLT
ncbi:MAG: hypothetical protein HC933_07495 [Pleurocapsa sp. SU_196_0]|nr:hypothetical protein [Pleurocapsa sp. SU_196_0]